MANYGGGTYKSGKRFGLQFSGWSELITQLDELSHFGAMEGAKSALVETHKLVTPKVESAIAPHRRTGRTERSIAKKANMTQIGSDAWAVDIGFDLDKGGLPSIFLMYGTPRMKPDKKLYESIYGRTTSNEIKHVQYHAIKDVIDKYMSIKGVKEEG